jgi:hypothetical protein
MVRKYFLATAFVSITGSAFPQTTAEYYLVQDVTSRTCTVVDKKPEPTATNVVQVGPDAFKSRSEAEAAMKTIKACASN